MTVKRRFASCIIKVCFKVQIYAGTLLSFQGGHGARGAVEKVFPLEINFKKVCMCASQGAWILACSHDEFISLPIETVVIEAE